MSSDVVEYQINDEWPDLESTTIIKNNSEKKVTNKIPVKNNQSSNNRKKWEKIDIDFSFCTSSNMQVENKENKSQFNRRRNYRGPIKSSSLCRDGANVMVASQSESNNTDKENEVQHSNTPDYRQAKHLRLRNNNANNPRSGYNSAGGGGRKFGSETNRPPNFYNNQARNNRGRFNGVGGNRSHNYSSKRMANQATTANLRKAVFDPNLRRFHSSDKLMNNKSGSMFGNGQNICPYPTGVPLMIAPVFPNQQIDPSKSGLLTTVSAGTIGGKQILFVPTPHSSNTAANSSKNNNSSNSASGVGSSINSSQIPIGGKSSSCNNVTDNPQSGSSTSAARAVIGGVLPGTTNIQQFFSGTPGLPPHVNITEYLVISQVDYYFSENNLYKDQFLRSKMDPDAWVDLTVVNGFKKLLAFNLSVEELAKVMSKSSQVEVDMQALRIRPALNPTKWTMLPRTKHNSSTNDENGLSTTGALIPNLNPNAPEFVPQNDAMDDVSSQDDSAFLSQKLDSKSNSVSSSSLAAANAAASGSAPNSTSTAPNTNNAGSNKPLSIQDRHRLALQAKNNAKIKGRQRLNSSMMSEEDVDDTMLPYLFIISPDSPDVSPEHSDSLSTCVAAPSRQPAAPNTARHPAGDRQPFFLSRSKMNMELEEMIRFGLEEYETEYRNKTGFRSRASSTTSDSKVNLISRQEFDALSQTLLDTHVNKQQQQQQLQCGGTQHHKPSAPPPPPPQPSSSSSSSGNKPAGGSSDTGPDFMDTFGPICPTIIGIPTTVNDVAYPPGAYMYFPPAAAGQPAHMTLLPQVPLSVSLCDSQQQQPQQHHQQEHESQEDTLDLGGEVTPTCDDQPQPLKPILKLKHDSCASSGSQQHHRHQHSKRSSARQIVGFFPAGSDRYATTNKRRRQRLYSEGENMQLETHVGFAFDTRSHNAASGTGTRSRTASTSSEPEAVTPTATSGRPTITSVGSSGSVSSDVSHFGLRNHRSHAILKSHGFTLHGYTKFRQYALKDREINGMGLSQEMNTLYRFWSFFLRENFNKSMFQEFRALALEDAQSGCCGSRYGLECLFRFYSYGLELRFRSSLLRHFMEDTLRDYEQFGNKYGLEKFWAFLHYSGRQAVAGGVLDHPKSGGGMVVDVGPRLYHLLQQYSTLEDLRADFKPPDGFFIDRTRIGSEK